MCAHTPSFSASITRIVALGLTAGFLNAAAVAPVRASTIGVDLTGPAGDFSVNPSDSWTLGFEFSLAAPTSVDGLGFWDLTGQFAETTVGLWTNTGTFLGSVSTASSPVTTTATANGLGTWNFMPFAFNLAPGNYVVGSWGDGMEYTWDASGGGITANVLTFVVTREQSGGIFQYPSQEFCSGCEGFFGANISFGEASAVPEPASLLLLAGGLGSLAARRRLKRRG